MSNSYFNLASGPLQQNWSNAGLITADNNWSGVPSIEGFIGADLVTTIGANAGGVTASSPPSDLQVLANRNNPISTLLGGVAEFAIANPTIALQGSGQADAPHLILYLDATGQHDITVAFNARDIEAGNDNAVQQIAVQYRIGETGPWINLPPTGQPPSTPQIADATTGPGVADLVTPVSVVLPSAVNNQAQVQVRIITTNAVDNDEWVGIDDINVSSSAAPVNTVPGTQSVDEELRAGDQRRGGGGCRQHRAHHHADGGERNADRHHRHWRGDRRQRQGTATIAGTACSIRTPHWPD